MKKLLSLFFVLNSFWSYGASDSIDRVIIETTGGDRIFVYSKEIKKIPPPSRLQAELERIDQELRNYAQFGTIDPINRTKTFTPIEEIDEDRIFVDQNGKERELEPFHVRVEFEEEPFHIRAELERVDREYREYRNYLKSAKEDGFFLTPEDITQFFMNQGYDVEVIDRDKDSLSYLNPSELDEGLSNSP